jgi:hypothetical protein
MVYREIIAVCSQIHTKHINTLCGQNVEFVNVKLVVRIVTTGLYRVNLAPDRIPVNTVAYQQVPCKMGILLTTWQAITRTTGSGILPNRVCIFS